MELIYIIQTIRSKIPDYLATGFSCLGSDLFFLCVLSVIFWCFSKKAAYKLFFAYAWFVPVISIINEIVQSPFPWLANDKITTVSLISRYAAGYSVPSIGLFTAAILGIGIIVNNSNIAVRITCAVLTLIAAFSYMYLGLCSLWSAIASLIAGGILVTVFSKFVDGTLFDISQYPRYLAISAIPSLILLIVSVSLYLNGVTDIGAFSVYLRIAGMAIAFLFSWFFESNFVRFTIRCDKRYKQLLKAVIGSFSTIATWAAVYIGFNLLIPGFWPAPFICNLLVTLGSFSAFPVLIKGVFS